VRLSAPHAALANGTQVQSFELDDVHRAGVLHVGAVVLPALIAIAEQRRNLSGRDFLAAAAAGYEVGPRVGLCMGPEHIGQGWHSGATVGVFAAGAAAARALHLDAGKAVHALGIAGTQAAGLMAAQYGAMVKRMHAGRASQSGLYGALLAEQGFTGIENVFEAEYGGFCTTFSRSQDRFRLAELSAGLGSTWQTMGVALKFYSCVGSNHTTLDALRALQAEHRFSAADVQHIAVHGSQVTADHVGWKYQPAGMTAAQLNLPFCAATLLIEGDCFVEQFQPGAERDPHRIALAERVAVLADPAITAKGAKHRHEVRVAVELRDGRRLARTQEAPRGSEQNFAADADVIAKFEKLAAHALPAKRVAELRDAVLGLDRLCDAAELGTLLADAG
jgi:aconitate decarboxylase